MNYHNALKYCLISVALIFFAINCSKCSDAPKCPQTNFSFTADSNVHAVLSRGHDGHTAKGHLDKDHGYHRKITHIDPKGNENHVFDADWHLPPVFAHSSQGGMLICVNTFIEPKDHDKRCGLPHHENGVKIQCSYKGENSKWSKPAALNDGHNIKWITHLLPLANNQFTLVYQVLPADIFALFQEPHHGEYKVNFDGKLQLFSKPIKATKRKT